MKNIFFDGLVGFLMFAGLAYLSDTFKDKAYYFKIVAFVWAAPFTYFYLLYITSRAGKKALNGFNTHAIIGTVATLLLILLSQYLQTIFKIDTQIITILALTLIFTVGYIYFKIFEKI